MSVRLDRLDLSKHVIILTGATDGIGKDMARILAGFNPKRLVLPAPQFLLTLLLLDTIKKSVSAELPGKIALTSSEANQFGEIDFDNLNLEKGNYWNPIKAYGNTKLMNVIVAKELGRLVQDDNITTYSLHPGVIQTNIGHLNYTISNVLFNIFVSILRLKISSEQGAMNTLYPIFPLEIKETGKYYNLGIEHEPNKIAYDQEIAKKLWDEKKNFIETLNFKQYR
ncbi:hypothetical protein RhiirA1_536914 [Rhizophagus irregularis]|uniref:NAD(P)-binding protein n=1 Tax=Rhizophagus irregularis TaxID=588596 RepID=A0A2N0RMX0_9GLOM|nr:hypothetical protein RhiirA1_536914 [Rhizophagus irregularis]